MINIPSVESIETRHKITRHEYLCDARKYAKSGNQLPHAKLTPDIVQDIRKNRHGKTARQWAECLGLHVRTIDAVISRKNWANVVDK